MTFLGVMAFGIANKADPGPVGITALLCAALVTSIVSGILSALRWLAVEAMKVVHPKRG